MIFELFKMQIWDTYTLNWMNKFAKRGTSWFIEIRFVHLESIIQIASYLKDNIVPSFERSHWTFIWMNLVCPHRVHCHIHTDWTISYHQIILSHLVPIKYKERFLRLLITTLKFKVHPKVPNVYVSARSVLCTSLAGS